MAATAQKTRRYESPRRREQAAETRRSILEAAQPLFERDGYAATSMAAIAREAGVATKTVYLAFETKSGLLRALWHRLLRGEQDEVPVQQQPWTREVLDEPDPQRQLVLTGRNSRMIKERAAGIMEVMRTAAPADPDIAALWSRIQTEFHAVQRSIVHEMHKNKSLKRGLGVDRAADILWTLNHPDVWQLLVGQRGWTPAQYERWLVDALRFELLGQAAA